MKNLKNLSLILSTAIFALSSCKYEEGPGISFRAKRDRVANEWSVTGYTVNGQNSDANKNSYRSGDTIENLFILNRDAGYTFNMQYTKEYADSKSGSKTLSYSRPDAPAVYAMLQNQFKANCVLQRQLKAGGKWTFVNKHKTLRFGIIGNPDVSTDHPDSQGEDFFDVDVVMLKNKMMKLKFKDGSDEHVITFEPRNPERIK